MESLEIYAALQKRSQKHRVVETIKTLELDMHPF